MIEVMHSKNFRRRDLGVTDKFTTAEQLGVGDMTGIKHSGMRFSRRELGVLRQDLSLEDVSDNVADPLARKKRKFLRRFTTNDPQEEQKVPETEGKSTTSQATSEYLLQEDIGGHYWQKQQKTYGIRKHSKPQEVGILDWGREKKSIKRNSRWGAALLAVSLPLMVSSYDLVETFTPQTIKATGLATLGFAEELVSLCGTFLGSGLIINALNSYNRRRKRIESNGTTRFSHKEINALTSPLTEQGHITNRPLFAGMPYMPYRVDVKTTEGNTANVTVLVYDQKKNLLHY